ncbi:hypothetical protein QUB63_25745 [Microcoleus sp. ARI1-B5]|uniref:hypothetical protein n=1 Tax=unclassified Microcoleus TaxID=2642155 RepID=UPI002FD5BDBE
MKIPWRTLSQPLKHTDRLWFEGTGFIGNFENVLALSPQVPDNPLHEECFLTSSYRELLQ